MRAFILALTISSALLGSTAFAGDSASDFNGDWTGTGTWIDGSIDNIVTTAEALHFQLSPTGAELKECWFYKDSAGQARQQCIASHFDVEVESLYADGKKVGDIFPDQILIYQGNKQVGEQINIEEATDGTLRYRYSYINMDGASIRREAHLKRVSQP